MSFNLFTFTSEGPCFLLFTQRLMTDRANFAIELFIKMITNVFQATQSIYHSCKLDKRFFPENKSAKFIPPSSFGKSFKKEKQFFISFSVDTS